MLLDSGVERRAPPRRASAIARALAAIGHSIVPVAALIAVLALAWAFRSEAASELHFLTALDPSLDPAQGDWLNRGVLVLPAVFFVLNLTSRRHGPSIAFGATLASWALIAGGIFWAAAEGLIASFVEEVAPAPTVIAFTGSLLLGQIANIYLFDRLRGIPWWEAPFVAALMGGLVFTASFHTATGGEWNEAALPRLAVLGAIQLVWALGQLVPTQMLRRSIRPCPGYGGA